MNKTNVSEGLEVRTSSAQWAVQRARQIVNKNSLQANELTQNVVELPLVTPEILEENIYQDKDLWNKVKNMLLQ